MSPLNEPGAGSPALPLRESPPKAGAHVPARSTRGEPVPQLDTCKNRVLTALSRWRRMDFRFLRRGGGFSDGLFAGSGGPRGAGDPSLGPFNLLRASPAMRDG